MEEVTHLSTEFTVHRMNSKLSSMDKAILPMYKIRRVVVQCCTLVSLDVHC